MPGRKRRMSRYMSASLRRSKNIHTRRTKTAMILRDVKRLGMTNSNKRLNKKGQ